MQLDRTLVDAYYLKWSSDIYVGIGTTHCLFCAWCMEHSKFGDLLIFVVVIAALRPLWPSNSRDIIS